MPFTGSSGFDIYVYRNGSYKYCRTFVPPMDMTDGYESIAYFPNREKKDIIINFPLYDWSYGRTYPFCAV